MRVTLGQVYKTAASPRRGPLSLGKESAPKISDTRSQTLGQLHVTRIKQRLNGMFDGLIDMSDASKDAHEKETQFLTRSLAAYAIHRIGKIEPNLAASCVTDGYGDLGIDGVYFDRDRNALVLVQAKWHGKGVSGFDVGGSHKFVDGVRSILNTDIDNANKKIQAMKNDILDAVTDPAVTLQLVPISNAESAFSLEVKQVFEQFQDELNGSGTELASFLRMDQAKIYESLLDKDRSKQRN